jgi:hypothetical protein
MTLARFLLGILLAALALAPLGLAARRVRRRLLPGWGGGDALMGDVVLGLSGMVVVAEILGTVGWFRTAPLVLGLLALSLAVLVLVRDRPTAATAASTPAVPRWHLVLGAVALVPVVASWAARLVRALDEGIHGPDTVWYHLPAAARFLQTGRVSSVHFFDDGPVTAYYPMTSSLLHAEGMVLFGSDALSAVANVGALGLALLAAWRIGARFGVAVPAAVALGLLLGGPMLVETQAGTALNDVAGIALLLVAVAVSTRGAPAGRTHGHDVVTGLALGLAIGMKLTFLVPAGLLALGLVATAGRRRWLASLAIFGATAATGLYWYGRNLLVTGNPVPVLDAGAGPVTLDAVTGSPDTRSFSHYVLDGDAWREYFVPGLADSLGPLWVAVLALVLVGLVGSVVAPAERSLRLVGLVGLASLVAFALTPQYLDLAPGQPFFFPTNLRYAAPALALGLALSAIVLRRLMPVVLPLLVALTLVAQADPVSWPVLRSRPSFFTDQIDGASSLSGLALVLGVGGLAVGVARWRSRGARAIPSAGWLVLAGSLVVLVGVAIAHPRYTERRYRDDGGLGALFAWSQGEGDRRIGAIGSYAQSQYPLTGPDLGDHVQYLVVETPDGGARRPRTCEELVGLIEDARLDHVVVLGAELVGWVATQPDAQPVPGIFEGSTAPREQWTDQLFEMDPDRSDRRC